MVLAYHYLIGRASERKQYSHFRVSEPTGEAHEMRRGLLQHEVSAMSKYTWVITEDGVPGDVSGTFAKIGRGGSKGWMSLEQVIQRG